MTQYTQFGAVDKLSVATSAAANSTIKPTTQPLTLAVIGSVAFHVKIGATSPTPPAAADTDFYYPAGTIFYFDIPVGQELSVRGAATGSVYVQRALQAGG